MGKYIKADALEQHKFISWTMPEFFNEQSLEQQAYQLGWNNAIEAIMENEPTVDIPQWIPCSERLPYSQEDVLCDDDGRVTIGYYTDEEVGWHDTHSYRIYPTAWMPLPEPWKGGRG